MMVGRGVVAARTGARVRHAPDGVKLEKEIRRTMGDPRFNSVIRFTKTVINPPADAALFATATP